MEKMNMMLIVTVIVLKPERCQTMPVKAVEGEIRDDIVYPLNSVRLNYVNTWTNLVVPYSFTSFEHPLIFQAMEEIQRQTCIQFQRRTFQREFIRFTAFPQGCWSWIGKQFNTYYGQEVNIGPECVHKGIIIHEILHAIGLFHEQTRPDRDSYVQINWNNIAPNAWQNFLIEEGYPMQNSEPYDYGSIMHYGPYDFARFPNAPTIIPRQLATQMGQRTGLSQGDIRRIKKLYNCT